jgi:predicted amidohydrolase YtcJ
MTSTMNSSYQKRLLTNANIITLDRATPSADWLMTDRALVLCMGHSSQTPEPVVDKSIIIDCQGKTIVPGFIDAHFHLFSFVNSLATLDLSPRNDVHSIEDLKFEIESAAKKLPRGRWVRARGYDEFYFAENHHPTKADLDHVALHHPIRITHRSGHADVLNSLALQQVGISRETGDPVDGLIDRDPETGHPTGLLFEMGPYLSERIPPLSSREVEEGIRKASQLLSSVGITSIQDATSTNDRSRWETVKRWKAQKLLTQRVNMMMGIEAFNNSDAIQHLSTPNSNLLYQKGVKVILDETTGKLYPGHTELNKFVYDVHRKGGQIAIHAIEENAVKSACDAIEYALEKTPGSDHRHRIEHCSVCPPDLCERLAALGIVVVTQPAFLFFNGDRYHATVPASQRRHLYPFESLLQSGVRIAGSSDAPIVPPHPLTGIMSAIDRKSDTGYVLTANERLNPLDALRMFTQWAAYAGFDESWKGTLSPGKVADMVVLSGDPTRASSEEIKNISVEMTIIDGQIVFSR